jgi:flagellar hook-basal body complex protein FliE
MIAPIGGIGALTASPHTSALESAGGAGGSGAGGPTGTGGLGGTSGIEGAGGVEGASGVGGATGTEATGALEGAGGAEAGGGEGGFGGALTNAIASLEQTQQSASSAAQGLATGAVSDPESAVVTVEEAQLAMQLASQIRTKATEAAQQIFQTQV